jgi:hypothetical protein
LGDWGAGFFGAGAGTGTLCATAIGVTPTIKAATSAATPAFRITISAAPRIPAAENATNHRLSSDFRSNPIGKRPAHG